MKRLFESIDQTGEFEKSPAYSDYKMLLDEFAKMIGHVPENQRDELSDKFYSNAEMLIRYGNFKKIGKGSSRTAYSFDSDPRYVLKFAHNDNGLRQNQSEIKNAKLGSGDYECTVRILAYDDNNVLIVEDNCKQSTYDDWDRILGVSPNMLSKIVRTMFEKKLSLRDLLSEIRDPETASELLKKTSAMDDEYTPSEHRNVVSCLENVLKAYDGETDSPKWKAIADLFRFYCDNGLAAMIPEELLYTDQWGIRPGKTPDEDALIIIDPGVDSDFMPFVGKNGRVR